MAVLTPAGIRITEILLATDYSAASEAALPFAVELARHFEAGLHVVHVLLPGEWEPTADDTSTAFPYKPVETAERQMASFLSTTDVGGVRCEYLVRQGQNVWEELNRIVQDKDIGLIILGTHGRSGIRKLLVGSVAEEVFRRSSIPVLTIGPHVGRMATPAFRNIAFATDLTPESLEHLPFVLAFAEDRKAQVTVVHAVKAYAPDIVAATHQRMRELIPPQANLKYVVEIGDPATVINRVAEQANCDLIMLGAHLADEGETHFSGAIAHRVLLEARCPVLTVHWFNKG